MENLTFVDWLSIVFLSAIVIGAYGTIFIKCMGKDNPEPERKRNIIEIMERRTKKLTKGGK